MSMSLMFLIAIFISICIVVTLYFVVKEKVKPSKLFYVLIGLTIAVWASFITGLFTILPSVLANVLWESSWISLLILGMITFIYEFKRSKLYAISVLVICLINGSVYLLTKLIASM